MHLHSPLQAAAERAVGRKQACGVALDPRSGRVLALVNEEMACRTAYPPGSTLKLIMAFAGLEAGIVTPETTVQCRSYKAGRETLICSRPGGHGEMNLDEAIAQSCNIYCYTLAERLGPERLLAYMRGFGLGSAMGGTSAGTGSRARSSRRKSRAKDSPSPDGGWVMGWASASGTLAASRIAEGRTGTS